MKTINFSDYPELSELVHIKEINEPNEGTITEISKIHFSADDTPYFSNNNPCVVPIQGYNYSYYKSIFIEIDNYYKVLDILNASEIYDIGICLESNELNNGTTILVNKRSFPIYKYRQATGIRGETGFQMFPYEKNVSLGIYSKENPMVLDFYLRPGLKNVVTNAINLQLKISTWAIPGENEYPNFKTVAVIEENEEKLCKDCKKSYSSKFYQPPIYTCSRLEKTINLVNGEHKSDNLSCELERYYGECGIKGKFWEKK